MTHEIQISVPMNKVLLAHLIHSLTYEVWLLWGRLEPEN